VFRVLILCSLLSLASCGEPIGLNIRAEDIQSWSRHGDDISVSFTQAAQERHAVVLIEHANRQMPIYMEGILLISPIVRAGASPSAMFADMADTLIPLLPADKEVH
jgi:hypothetical protein